MLAKLKKLALPADPLQYFGLLIAFVLIVSANEFAAARPVLTAVLVFVFSLPYLVASIIARRANLLYATMLLGAVSYFLACHAMGAPSASFPLLSVPLVVILLAVGYALNRKLPARWASYPKTVFRAMNITVAVFSIWALREVGDLMAQPGPMRYVAGLAFLGYAVLYLVHCIAGAPVLYAYVFSGYLAFGSVFSVAALSSGEFCWIPATASAGAILLVGTRLHRSRGYAWSRHLYFSAVAVLVVSLVLSLARWSFLLMNLSLASLLLWAAYRRLAAAVGDARYATMAERVAAKCFFFGGLVLSVPVVPLLFVLPGNVYVACAGLICGLTFCWISWSRRDQVPDQGRLYVLAAALFCSAGVLALGRHLPGWLPAAWSVAVLLALAGGLALLRSRLDEAKHGALRGILAAAVIFPAFFAWYIPLLHADWAVALGAAAAAAAVAAVLGLRYSEKSYCYALGPAVAGACIAGSLMLAGQGSASWIACTAAAAAAGGIFLWAGARRRPVTRGAANLAWLVLSGAAVIIAGAVGAGALMYCATALGVVAVLLTARAQLPPGRDVFSLSAATVAVLATILAVAAGPFSGAGPVIAGACLLILSAGHWLAWGLGRGLGPARAACWLGALGLLVVIFGNFPAADARLAASAGVVVLLFLLASAGRERFGPMASTAIVTGHLTSAAVACAVLIQCWSASPPLLPLAAAGYVALYALMPRLRNRGGFRTAALLWLSFAVLLGLATHFQTPYRQQIPMVVFLSVFWMAAGYALARLSAGNWSVPLYVCAAVLAGLCGAVTLFAPHADDNWLVFLANGIVFACLFLLLRQDVFVYLLTLSLSLMAYTWVKASTTVFTQDVLFYLVIGAAVLGVSYALSYFRKFLARLGSVPLFGIFTWQGRLLVGVVVAGVGILLVSVYSATLTGHPRFCTSCHYMGDYYESWQHSSHKNVACIDCHYEPGVTSTVMGKVEGLVQVVKYVSHSYGAKPAAMISNRSCMRAGCHAEMGTNKETLVFHGKIRFRHDKHLSEHPRGKELNCVSCHGQTVQGQHIGVTETTCVTCHFYGHGKEDKLVAAGQCLTCHEIPDKAVTFMGQSFAHRKFLKGNETVRCWHCHSQVTQGDGRISRTRCRSCHLAESTEMTDQVQFHLTHVSKGHFECLQCHDEIKHGIRPMEQQLLASGNCRTCHEGERHSLQERIYAGTAVAGMKASPDVMYKAGVACDGCHTDVRVSGTGVMSFTKRLSGARQCADCHGKKRYGEMLAMWQEGTKERIAELRPVLEKLEKVCGSSGAPAEQVAKARKLLDAARAKIACVVADGSYGAHNFEYITTMLDDAEEQLEQCRSLTAGWAEASAREAGQ